MSRLRFDLRRLMHRLSEVGEDGMFGPALEPGQEYQIRVVENTVTTDAKGREGEVFDRNVIMTLSMQCGIWKAPLSWSPSIRNAEVLRILFLNPILVLLVTLVLPQVASLIQLRYCKVQVTETLSLLD